MSNRREFEIAYLGLTPGIHVYDYRIEDKFFVPFGEQDFTNCITDVKLTLDKNNNFMQLKFDIDGKVDVLCDRCGNTLRKQLWDEFNIVVKLVDNPEEMNQQEEDPDVYYISRTESHLYTADWIYEFINLSLPMQKMCDPEEMGGPMCNTEVLGKLKKMEEDVMKSSTNSLWQDLEKFKDLE